MKTGWFFCLFAVKGIVLGLFFKGVKKPSKLHIHMHWNHVRATKFGNVYFLPDYIFFISKTQQIY